MRSKQTGVRVVLEDLRVDGGDAVGAVAGHDAQVSHVDALAVALLDDRHPAQALEVAWPFRAHLLRAHTAHSMTRFRNSECSKLLTLTHAFSAPK